MELEAGFVQTPSGKDAWGHDVIFEFTGDDDFWLYVDGELVIDLGGIHSALAGSVNFSTGQVIVNGVTKTLRQIFQENYTSRNPSATQTDINAYLAQYFEGDEVVFKDYSAHTMKIFYMERGAGASNLHNRKFTLKALKSDSRTNEALPNAHFALYRSVKSSLSGMIRDYDPLPGYEDLVTDENGYIPQLDSTLPPGTYYLTEKDPPVGYEGLSEDIIFTISPLGVITINIQEHSGFLQSSESENDYLYLISVPNSKINSTAILTITKTVKGSFGSNDKDFTFTLNVDGADASEEYVWTKNGTVQAEELHPNGTFSMKNGDEVSIVLPINSDITITEHSESLLGLFAKAADAG